MLWHTLPMSSTRRAGLYCRISRDKVGAGLGVERQEQDCRALAEREGWEVTDLYVDNDISASTGRLRPQYERLLDDLKAGRIDAVVAWHPDRLHRRPDELERFITTVEGAHAEIRTCTAGELDLSTPSGRMVARMLGAAARHEVEHAQERMLRKWAAMRDKGLPHPGARVFGYRPGGMEIDQREADALRAGARSVLAGQSPAAVAREWNGSGIATSTGGAWTGQSVARVLTRPRHAGLVEHDGAVVGSGAWPAIFDTDTYEGVRAVLGDGVTPKGEQRRTVRLLLSGVAVCGYPVEGGECGTPIRGAGSNASGRRYRCGTGGHLTRLAADLDAHVTDIALDYLTRPEAVALVAADRSSAAQCHAAATAIHARMDELAEMFAAGEIDRRRLQAGSERGRTDLDAVEKQLAALTAGTALDGLAGRADAARVWETLSLDRKRAAIDALMTITLLPSKRGGTGGTRFAAPAVRVEPRF